MAVPAAVAQSKLTAFPLAAESETVNVAVVVPALPSATETSFTERVGAGSLSVIVATPWASLIWPGEPTRFVRLTTNVSLGSSIASPAIGTETTLEVADFVKVTVPDDAVKSPGAVAVPGAVAQLTWSAQQTFGGGATWIVNDAVATAPVPSVTVASEIVTEGVGAAAAGGGEGEDEHGGGPDPGHESDQRERGTRSAKGKAGLHRRSIGSSRRSAHTRSQGHLLPWRGYERFDGAVRRRAAGNGAAAAR